MRVLLADDSILMISRLQEVLSDCKGVEIVGIAENGQIALEKTRQLVPDLLILDLKMPKMSGINVLREIRKEDKKIKIMVLTSFSSEDYGEKTLELGANYFFSKVDDFEKVLPTVQELLISKFRR